MLSRGLAPQVNFFAYLKPFQRSIWIGLLFLQLHRDGQDLDQAAHMLRFLGYHTSLLNACPTESREIWSPSGKFESGD